MDTLRIINVAVWAAVLIYMVPGAWAASFGKHTRRGDPMRLSVLVTAVLFLGFNLRWLLAPENDVLWQALLVLSAADGIYIAWLAKAYGRGGKL